MLSRYDLALSGLFDLIVILEQVLQMTTWVEVIGWVCQLFQSHVLYYSMRNKNKVRR